MTINDLTPTSAQLFIALAKDAGNWSDMPLLHDGNVDTNLATRGNITDLKVKGLIKTTRDEGCTWVLFTEAGSALAATVNVKVQALA